MTTQQHKQPRPGDFCFCSVQLQLAGVFLLVRDPWAIAFAFALLLLPTAPPPGDFVGTPPVQLAGGAPFGEEPLDIGAISVMCHVLGSGSWCFSLLIYAILRAALRASQQQQQQQQQPQQQQQQQHQQQQQCVCVCVCVYYAGLPVRACVSICS